MTANNRVFSSEETTKLDHLMREGVQTLQEVEDLTEGLNDTVKAIAEELQIKPAVLKKAIKTAQKDDFQNKSEDHDLLETILASVKRI